MINVCAHPIVSIAISKFTVLYSPLNISLIRFLHGLKKTLFLEACAYPLTHFCLYLQTQVSQYSPVSRKSQCQASAAKLGRPLQATSQNVNMA